MKCVMICKSKKGGVHVHVVVHVWLYASTCSLPLMFVWAFILWIVVIWMRDINILMSIASRMFWSGWLLCEMGCLIWVFRRYKTLRQSVNIWVGSSWYVVVSRCRVWCMAIISARSIFCSPGSLSIILRSLKGL